MDTTMFLGLDVHSEWISVALAEAGRSGEVRSWGRVPNTMESVRKLVNKLCGQGRQPEQIEACYEAGPCGYVLYWQLVGLGINCTVIAPSLIPSKPGDRVKTDRRDAEKLARCHRAGELTAVFVPSPEQEALRDLVRCREAAKADQKRARHRLSKFLLRHGRCRPHTGPSWGVAHLRWVREQRFDLSALQYTLTEYLSEVEHAGARLVQLEGRIDEAVSGMDGTSREVIAGLQALRGVAKLTAVSVVAELGRLDRFASPAELMSYCGMVSSEHSSGGPGKAQRGGITKTGNRHLRRLMVESAWAYRHLPAVRGKLQARQKRVGPESVAIAWKAQKRLHEKYRKMVARGKEPQKVVVAVGRELLGFVWDIARTIERAAGEVRR